MRKKNSTYEMKHERDLDLFQAYRRLAARHLHLYGRISAGTLLRQLVVQPASRYWVTAERAYRVVRAMEKGLSMERMKGRSQRFYKALHADYRAFREANPDMPAKEAIERVVQGPAPCFTMSPRVAGMIISQMRKRCQEEKIKRLRRACLWR